MCLCKPFVFCAFSVYSCLWKQSQDWVMRMLMENINIPRQRWPCLSLAAAREAMQALSFVVLKCQANLKLSTFTLLHMNIWGFVSYYGTHCFFFSILIHLEIICTYNFVIIRKPFAQADFSYSEILVVVDLFLIQKGCIWDSIGKYFKQTKIR